MTMTIKYPDGSVAQVMQQTDGDYIIIAREGELHKVLFIEQNVTQHSLAGFVRLSQSGGAQIKTEYMA